MPYLGAAGDDAELHIRELRSLAVEDRGRVRQSLGACKSPMAVREKLKCWAELPIRSFNSSPELTRPTETLCIRYPLSLMFELD